MPDHVMNVLSAEGDPKEVKRLFATIGGGRDEYGEPILIDFNKIKPIPKSLDIECSSRSDKALENYTAFIDESSALAQTGVALGISETDEHKEKVARLLEKHTNIQNDNPKLWKLGKQCYENIVKHGAPTWYEWVRANWGTKWNAYSQGQSRDSEISFQTAGANVNGLIEVLSAQFPKLRFSYFYAAEDFGCNAGHVEYENGERTLEHCPKDGSLEAMALATEILGDDIYAEEMEPEIAPS